MELNLDYYNSSFDNDGDYAFGLPVDGHHGIDNFVTGNESNRTFQRLEKAAFEHHGVAKFSAREWDLIFAMIITSCIELLIAILVLVFCLRPALGPFLQDKLDIMHDMEKAHQLEIARIHAEEIRAAPKMGKKWISKYRKPGEASRSVGKVSPTNSNSNSNLQTPLGKPKSNPGPVIEK